MLILSRKAGQRILIGDNIEVVVVEVRQGSVRLGIDAPTDVAVDRLEVRESKDAEAVAE